MEGNHTPVLLQEAVDQFQDLILCQGEHSVVAGDQVYIQPYVYLSTHLVQMRAQGWDVDFDQVAALSGASALFACQLGEFMPSMRTSMSIRTRASPRPPALATRGPTLPTQRAPGS